MHLYILACWKMQKTNDVWVIAWHNRWWPTYDYSMQPIVLKSRIISASTQATVSSIETPIWPSEDHKSGYMNINSCYITCYFIIHCSMTINLKTCRNYVFLSLWINIQYAHWMLHLIFSIKCPMKVLLLLIFMNVVYKRCENSGW